MSDIDIDTFKNYVKLWIELDATIKKTQEQLKERKQHKKVITDKILRFMAMHDLSDLNTRTCHLRYRITYTKPAVSVKEIKTKLLTYFEQRDSAGLGEQVVATVFENDHQRVERPTLRKVRISRNTLLSALQSSS